MEDWFLIYSFGLSNPQLQQATGVSSNTTKNPEKVKEILEDIKLFIAETIGIVGGIIWGINSKWDYEPVILLLISSIGMLIFFILKIIPKDESFPIVELELISNSGFRAPPKMIPDKSPRNEEGYYLQEVDGIYLYEIHHMYDLIIRNNSMQNAYNVKIYVPKVNYLKFKNETNSLEPLTINNPKTINLKYSIGKGMTHHEAEILLNNKITDELKKAEIIVEYQNEKRKKYYSKFIPLNQNERLKKAPKNLNEYRII